MFTPFTATMLAEGCDEMSGFAEDEIAEDLRLDAWQYLVNTGVVWSLQGGFGRMADSLIKAGLINPK